MLLHGIGVSHRYFARLHRELASGRQARDAVVYSFDLPGFGGTPRPGSQVSVGEYAAFVAAVLADAGVQSCVVVGHSMGAQFAVELALQEPGLVSRVVLMGPVVDPARRSAAWHALALTRDALFSETPATNVVVFGDYFRTGLRWYLTQLPVMLGYPLETRVCGVAPARAGAPRRQGPDRPPPVVRVPRCAGAARHVCGRAGARPRSPGHCPGGRGPGHVHWASTAAGDVTA